MANSPLVDVTILSPNTYGKRTGPIKKITIHHVAGAVSVESLGNMFKPASRKACSTYGIGSDARVGLFLDESYAPITSSNKANDMEAVTIEVSNCKGAPNWEVSDKVYAKLIDLCVDICKRNGIKQLTWAGDKNGTLTAHYFFSATACPGPYLKSKMADVAAQVNARLGTPKSDIIYNLYSPQDFINIMASYIDKHRKNYGIEVVSAPLAQAINESAFGASNKAHHNNYWGLKYRANRCPSSCGKFIDGSSEQKIDGSYVSVTDYWFEFRTMEDGVKGYFEFTNISNYHNIKGVKDPETYLINIKADNFASDHDYVQKCMKIIKEWNLTKYDQQVEPAPTPKPVAVPSVPYLVRIATDVLNVRSGPGTKYKINRTVGRNQIYTIVDETSDGWGKLKSGAGWICLAYTIKC